jgi:hypothetical protein
MHDDTNREHDARAQSALVRVPGVFRLRDIEPLLEPGLDLHLKDAGFASDGAQIFAVFRRECLSQPQPMEQ